MKNDRTPSEMIDHIGDIIREREQKSLPTFFTISIEQFEKITPVTVKECGYENFKTQVLKYMTDYQLTALKVQLYTGKSRNSNKSFQEFNVQLKKTKPAITFGNPPKESDNEIQQFENSIPMHRYYDEKFEMQMRIMRIEMEKQGLLERVLHLTEKYEDKLKEQDLRGFEKTKNLEQEVQTLKDTIRDFEQDVAKNEKDKHNSFGNIALGSISSRAIENFAKSNLGTGVLKSLLGPDGYQTLQGHLAGIESEQEKQIQTPQKETARIITNTNDPRQTALNFILAVCEKLADTPLRMIYDIVLLSQKNAEDLKIVWNVANQINEKRKNATEIIPNQNPETKQREIIKEKPEDIVEEEKDDQDPDITKIE